MSVLIVVETFARHLITVDGLILILDPQVVIVQIHILESFARAFASFKLGFVLGCLPSETSLLPSS